LSLREARQVSSHLQLEAHQKSFSLLVPLLIAVTVNKIDQSPCGRHLPVNQCWISAVAFRPAREIIVKNYR